MTKQLLTEKYRPSTIDTYVFHDESVKRKIEKWLGEKEIPNVMFSGSAGTGKTTISKILVNELDLDPSDVKWFNGSLDSGVGFIRETIEPWIRRSSFGRFKVVQLEEADRLTMDAQQALREIIEENHNVRWIFTCNYPNKIIPALHSRLQHIEMTEMDRADVEETIINIIEGEDIVFDGEVDPIEVIASHIDAYIPDLRKIINSIEEHTDESGILWPLTKAASSEDIDKWREVWEGDEALDIEEVLGLAMYADQNNYEEFYMTMYRNCKHFPDKEIAIVHLADYMYKANMMASQSLNLQAFLYTVFVNT